MLPELQTPDHWFREASQTYIERHQGCPWCGDSHCMTKRTRGSSVEYICMNCDFLARHDTNTDDYLSVPGEDLRSIVPDTMLDL